MRSGRSPTTCGVQREARAASATPSWRLQPRSTANPKRRIAPGTARLTSRQTRPCLPCGRPSSADEPIKDVALSLNELADSCDESIGDIVTSLAEVGGIITAAGGFFVGLMAAPEPAVTKILGVIVGVIGLIVAAVAALGAYVKAIEQRQQAPEEGIAELRTLVDRLRR